MPINMINLLCAATADINSSMDFTDPWYARLLDGCKTLVLGLLIVFSVLALLWGFLELFKVIFYHPEKQNKAEAAPEVPAVTETVEENNDEELTAVITAAVYAYISEECKTENKKVPAFRVVSFKKN